MGGRARAVAAIAAWFVAAALPAPSLAGTTSVQAVDNLFKPDDVSIEVGGAVEWAAKPNNQQAHNVHAQGGLFRSGEPEIELAYRRVFSAGTFFYFCDVHGLASPKMDGFVRVPVTIDNAPEGVKFTVVWATGTSSTGSKFDVQYRVGSGRWKKWKSGVRGFDAVFGKGGSPVTPAAGTKYSFRAKSADGDATSKWSPVASVTP